MNAAIPNEKFAVIQMWQAVIPEDVVVSRIKTQTYPMIQLIPMAIGAGYFFKWNGVNVGPSRITSVDVTAADMLNGARCDPCSNARFTVAGFAVNGTARGAERESRCKS